MEMIMVMLLVRDRKGSARCTVDGSKSSNANTILTKHNM